MMEAGFYFHFFIVEIHNRSKHTRQQAIDNWYLQNSASIPKAEETSWKGEQILKPRDPGCLLQDSDFYIWYRSYFYRTLKDVVAYAAQEW